MGNTRGLGLKSVITLFWASSQYELGSRAISNSAPETVGPTLLPGSWMTMSPMCMIVVLQLAMFQS